MKGQRQTMRVYGNMTEEAVAIALIALKKFVPGLSAESLVAALNLYEPNCAREKLLTRKEVAERLQCSLPTLNRMLNSGALPRVKYYKRAVRIPESAVNALIGTTI